MNFHSNCYQVLKPAECTRSDGSLRSKVHSIAARSAVSRLRHATRRAATWLAISLAAALHLPTQAIAEAGNCIVSSAPLPAQDETALPSCDQLYPQLSNEPVSPWKIGFAAGIGERSNPFINSDDIPVYGVVQLSYFGEHFFFDNGDLGWFIGNGERWNLNAIAGIGGERSFYSFLNDSSLGFNPGLDLENGTGTPATEDPDNLLPQPEPGAQGKPKAPERDLTADGGLELLYEYGMSELQLQLLTDISGKHHGQQAWFSWAVVHETGPWQVVPSLGFNWMSSDAADYYFGVKPSEASPGLPAYRAGSAVNTFARLSVNYTLNEHWSVVYLFQYDWLGSSIKDSPSIADDHVQTMFLGLYYEF